MNKQTDPTPYTGDRRYLAEPPLRKWLDCKSEMCQGANKKHEYNRRADDGRLMYVCLSCGEERQA
jgi:hypothetical protein